MTFANVEKLTHFVKNTYAFAPALAYVIFLLYLCTRKNILYLFIFMNTKPTITKAEIAAHFVTVDQLHEDLTNLVHDYYAQPHNHQVAV